MSDLSRRQVTAMGLIVALDMGVPDVWARRRGHRKVKQPTGPTAEIKQGGWLRIAYDVRMEDSGYHQFILTLWGSYESNGTPARQSLMTLGPFYRPASGFSHPIQVNPAKITAAVTGKNCQYRFQIQFQEAENKPYQSILDHTGKV